MRLLLLALLLAAATASPAAAQDLPKHEFRGAWIATVVNLDWPSCNTCSESSQKAELIRILDRLQGVGINAVLFQVRTESDAFYDSPYEPWSFWLTGAQGSDPGWDPLAFAVEESHARGMELHAWFNPYRADRGSSYPKAATHVTNQHPEWILDFGSIKILDPGLPAVRDYVTTVITDVARRYDIDGVHFDDYFYPYPNSDRGFPGITTEDDASFAAYGGGFDRANWRRFNVFRFVRQVRDSLAMEAPDVVFGISPFGIWKNGVPAGTTGLDAFNTLYADAVGWLDNDLIDYVTPQLYWAFGGGQDYGKLAPWWASVRNDRHLYPGHGLYRADANTYDGTLYASNEVPNQVRFNRDTEGIQGSVFFRAKNITQYSSKGFADSLRTDLYRHPALPPPMAWRSQDAPGAPTDLDATPVPDGEPGETLLSWSAPASGTADARFYAVYRIPEAEASDLGAAMARAENLLGVTGQTSLSDVREDGRGLTYVVTAVSANSIESAPSNAVVFETTDAEADRPLALSLDAPRPNPTAGRVTVPFTLGAASVVTLRVVDVLGREVARLIDGDAQPAGSQSVTWQARTPGTYLVVLDVEGQRAVRPLVVVR